MEQTQETQTANPEAAAATEAKPAPAPRVKLTLKHDGKEHALLKYPFPVKAARFPVLVNGAKVDAACTAGRGKAYTYLLINNTSFYVPGTLPVDAECEINFPEGYKFDDTVAPRVSNYKPKKKAKAEGEAKAEGDGAAEAKTEGGDNSGGTTDGDPVNPATAEAPKAKRRGK